MNEKDELRAAFNEAYASLNAAQKQAVDTIDGPVMVVAGPGTGKTQILTLRIANILLQTDTAPDSILALTFTESGAKAMRERLRRYLGARAYQVGIYTFHGFAQSLIRQYPAAYETIIGGRPATDLEKIHTIETLLADGVAPKLRTPGNPTYYVTPLLRMIGNLKQENISPDQLATLIAEQEQTLRDIPQYHEKGAHKGKVRGEYSKLAGQIEKNQDLLAIYRAYQAVLRERRWFDFEDMITETVRALREDETMRLELQERYQYILADEHQDVNGAQNAILELLTNYHERPNIFVVGDEKQAIYRFQGASLENFLYFTHAYEDVTVISLTENYRSGQAILAAAHDLIKVENGPLAALRLPLTAARVPAATIIARRFSHQAIEDDWLVAQVKATVAAGTMATSVAVIVRTNKEVEQMSNLLRQAGIAVVPSAEGDILSHPITERVRELLLAVASDDDAALATVLHGAYWDINQADVMRVLAARRYDRSLWAIVADETMLETLGLRNQAAVTNVYRVLTAARQETTILSAHQVAASLLRESGLLEHVIRYSPLEGTRVVRRLYDEIEALVIQDPALTLAAAARQLAARKAYNLPLTAPFVVTDRQAVQVLTAHKAKGLEFDTVFIPHLTDAGWSGKGKSANFVIPVSMQADAAPDDVIEDERRLLYVALTRAETTVYLSCAETNAAGSVQVPSRFVEQLPTVVFETDETAEQNFDPLAILTAGQSRASSITTTFLTTVLAERGLSATALNNYLTSPWNYIYRNVIRIPEPQSLSLQFGTTVHNVLERTVRTASADPATLWPSDKIIIQWLERELSLLPLSVTDYTQLHEKGLTALMAYLPHLQAQLAARATPELNIRVLLPTGLSELPELPLTGKLDRIDFDESGQALRVIDYKTGKPKSRNVIEGKTKNSNGDYKRQLTFYALLLELYDDERYRTRTGVLSFVEPTAHGEIKEEIFTITDEEIAVLKTELVRVAGEIISGECFAAPGSESDYATLVAELLELRT